MVQFELNISSLRKLMYSGTYPRDETGFSFIKIWARMMKAINDGARMLNQEYYPMLTLKPQVPLYKEEIGVHKMR